MTEPEDPWELLEQWLPDNEDPIRPVMTVITATADGIPDGRTQLLTEFNRDGFAFHADSRSRKFTQLDQNPHVALVLLFLEQKRQLTVQGIAEPVDDAELQWAYEHRSEYLQELAWLNTPEFAALPLQERLDRWAAVKAEHADGFTAPPTWAGRRVRPTRLTFWSGRDDTASRRVEYTATSEGGWTVSILAG